MSRLKVATVWLDGCSGCHMSLLDIDERLILLAGKIELVYSPLVDAKAIPEGIDLALVEGAVSTDHDLARLYELRKNSRLLVSLGDCAVTGNVPAMRDIYPLSELCKRVYSDNAEIKGAMPSREVPKLLPCASPVHTYVAVDVYVPGCPPSSDTIFTVLSELLEGRMPQTSQLTRFGA
jgi:NAD-reducing hydrogenase small subunit